MRTLILISSLFLVGCTAIDASFTCTTDQQCSMGGVAGTCEADTKVCSALDSACPSQRRYGAYAGPLANECVPRPPNWDRVADWCPLAATSAMNSNAREYSGTVALNTLVSDVQEVPKATGLVGPDGVFAFSVAPRERVAVKAELVTTPGTPAPAVDLAMYLMGSCDVASFIRRNDRCPAGEAEDLWWVMNDVPGTYYVGFDSRTYDASTIDPVVKITVGFPRHGDGKVDWGDACDDANVTNGDGCTADGLWELRNSGGTPITEKEPNNQPFGANVLVMNPGETMTVIGGTGDTCDNDFFSIDVPQGYFPRVTMLNFNGQDCVAATVGTIAMQFNRLVGTQNSEQVKLGDAQPVGTNACPSFTETSLGLSGLAAGRYGIEIKGFAVGKAHVDYRLRVELAQIP